ncbi:transposase [candidate division MSBL1 archaeon SCGC-AAA382F02]|uniref:Transposase n=1 Tax=candidate division MSBL1 archaeon SCGC-AAA382F02 TaxID=1698282 RepID=A0A133VHF0_9EURY|nr:transposase [candidate division MSBL1 archaeon SCGC-AAA382F02]
MQYELQKGRHSVFSLNFHLVVCVKYRREVFENQGIIDELKKRTRKIASNYDVTIKNQEVDKDHTHILFSAAPKTDLVKFINALKGATSRVIRNRFPEVKEKLWEDKFWSPSYFLATTGEVTLDVLKEYVENQGE